MNKKCKQKIIILSDLWGNEDIDYIHYYNSLLENSFEIKYYDSRTLAGISKASLSKQELHRQFINGGVDTAVENLLEEQKESSFVLGFSIGGYIAWKACNTDLKTEHLIAISSTRLRNEMQKPPSRITLIYGQEDTHRPDIRWFEKLNIRPNIYEHQGHELYRTKQVAIDICKIITE